MLAALAAASLATSDLLASGYEVYKEDISIGWPSQFYAATNTAVQTGRPIVMIWSNNGCDWCNHLKTAINESAKFAAWKAASGYDFLCVEGTANAENKAAQEFARTAGGTRTGLKQYPFVALVQYAGDKLYANNFVGRLPEYAASNKPKDSIKQDKETLVGMLMDNADSFFESVAVELQPAFAVGNTIGDRLEAEDFTAWVDVPFKRATTPAPKALEGTLRVTYPCAGGTSECLLPVVWADGEGEKSVHLDFTSFAGYEFKVGGEISLALCDAGGATVAESAIALVKRGNSPKNPVWVERKTADELSWGEWTMDLEVAAEKVSAAKAKSEAAYLLVSFGGSMWCPDCAKTERYLVDTDEFKSWALDRKVACVAIDIPNVDATIESRTGPCLLTREKKAANATYMAADPEHGAVQSGAGYLSRWMVTDEEAEAILNRNLQLLGTNTKNGGWNRPERANQYRTGVPVFALVNADTMKIVSRIELFASSSPTNANALAGHIRRFDELLAVETAVDAAFEEDNRDISTTTAEIAADGAAADGEVSGGDLVDMFAVTGVEFDKRTTLTATTTATVAWKLSLVQAGASGTNVVATSTGTGGITVSADLDEANGTDVYAKVELTALGSNAASFGADDDATVSYSLSAENVATPGTVGFDSAAAEAFIPNGNVFSVAVSRTGGRTGAVTVRVYLAEEGSAAEYNFDETNLVWSVGEMGTKEVSFEAWRPDDRLASGSFTLGLELVEGGELGTDSCEVSLTDTTAPCFASLNMAADAHLTFTAGESLALMNVKAGTAATLKKTSGSLPTGMRLAYDRKTGTVTLSGTPKTSGTFTATYTVTQNRVTGLPATITITVDDPKEANPFIGVARAAQTVPLFAEYGEGTNVVAATLTFSATAANRLTARLQELGKTTTTSFSGSWTDYDASTGIVSAELSTRTGRTLLLAMGPDGIVEAEVDGGAYVGEIDVPDSSFAEWAGSYTVTFPEDPSEAGDASMAFATLTISAKGVVKWSATLSSGQTASGTSQLCGSDGQTAFATLFKSTAKYAFSSFLKIRKGGGETWADQTANQIVHDAPGTATLECIGDDIVLRTAFGGWWTPNAQPSALLEAFAYGNDLLLVSEDMEPCEVLANASGFAFKVAATRTDRLTYTKKTGAFAGRVTLVTPAGASVKANIKGVLLPGWDDCGCVEPAPGEEALVTRPFGAGIISYSVRINRTTTTFSAPVYLTIDEK